MIPRLRRPQSTSGYNPFGYSFKLNVGVIRIVSVLYTFKFNYNI